MSNNNRMGLLIDYQYCTGCHSCEVACKKELGLAVGEFGITVSEDGPRKLPNGKWEWKYIPVPGELCNLCQDRVAIGKKPTCVHHCQAQVMAYGPISELAEKMNKGKMVLFAPH